MKYFPPLSLRGEVYHPGGTRNEDHSEKLTGFYLDRGAPLATCIICPKSRNRFGQVPPTSVCSQWLTGGPRSALLTGVIVLGSRIEATSGRGGMPKSSQDPVRSVKSFLHSADEGQAPGTIIPALREIGERLARARRTENRIRLSDGLEALFRLSEIPVK